MTIDATRLSADVIEQVERCMATIGMSKTELAEALGVSPGYVSHLLVGRKTNLTVETMAKLATALGADIEITLSNAAPSTAFVAPVLVAEVAVEPEPSE